MKPIVILTSEQKHRDLAFLASLLDSDYIATVRRETDLQVFLVLNLHYQASS